MAQRAIRLLIIVATVGVLLMHGADASATATHETAPAVGHEHHDADGTDGGHTVHWHHVAIACIAVLTAAVMIAQRSRRSVAQTLSPRPEELQTRWVPAASMALGTGPPRWLDLAVIRR